MLLEMIWYIKYRVEVLINIVYGFRLGNSFRNKGKVFWDKEDMKVYFFILLGLFLICIGWY